MEDVKAHPWYTGETATLDQVQQEFAERKARIDEENEQKRLQKEAEKAQRTGGAVGMRQAYRGAHRGDAEEEEESKFESTRILEDYIRIGHKNTEFFSENDADTLFTVLQ